MDYSPAASTSEQLLENSTSLRLFTKIAVADSSAWANYRSWYSKRLVQGAMVLIISKLFVAFFVDCRLSPTVLGKRRVFFLAVESITITIHENIWQRKKI